MKIFTNEILLFKQICPTINLFEFNKTVLKTSQTNELNLFKTNKNLMIY